MTSSTSRPTAFPDLNGVLDELVQGARSSLGHNLVGAYLTGSFAVGDADEHSDVDFLVVTRDEVSDIQLSSLQALHARLHRLPPEWSRHLEGSYAAFPRLRGLEAAPSPFLYLDNGAERLEPDTHCNTSVVRWVLRQHNVVLDGPDASSLVDPLPPDALRREALAGVAEYVEWAPAPTKAGGMSRWKQPYLVLTFCRLLHTLTFDTIVSKRVAGDWAKDHLDPQWRELICLAIDDRPDPWTRVSQPASHESVERTLGFAAYALAEAQRRRTTLVLK